MFLLFLCYVLSKTTIIMFNKSWMCTVALRIKDSNQCLVMVSILYSFEEELTWQIWSEGTLAALKTLFQVWNRPSKRKTRLHIDFDKRSIFWNSLLLAYYFIQCVNELSFTNFRVLFLRPRKCSFQAFFVYFYLM